MDRTRYQEEAARVIEARIQKLRLMSFAEAMELPEISSEEELLIADEKARVMVFRQHGPDQLEGRVLVTVLVSRSVWLGIASRRTIPNAGWSSRQSNRSGKLQISSS